MPTRALPLVDAHPPGEHLGKRAQFGFDSFDFLVGVERQAEFEKALRCLEVAIKRSHRFADLKVLGCCSLAAARLPASTALSSLTYLPSVVRPYQRVPG